MFKALNKTRGLYLRWRELDEGSATPELEWTTTELRNSLRSIEWDLEDLEDTINILFAKNFTPFQGNCDANKTNALFKITAMIVVMVH